MLPRLVIIILSLSACMCSPIDDPVLSIVGGQQAVRGSWPWTASITLPAIGYRQCGATIIAPNWLLTAGHCFSEYIYNEDWSVEIGGYEKADRVEKASIGEVFVHEEFDNRNYTYNDIALVKLNHSIVGHYQALALVNYQLLDVSQLSTCTVIGWGADKVVQDQLFADSPFLRQAEVPLVDVDECRAAYKPFQVDVNTQLCAGGNGKGSCFGDSGSPLQCWHNQLRRWLLVGITSYGIPCGHRGKPDVYTNVAAFTEWIHDTIQQHS